MLNLFRIWQFTFQLYFFGAVIGALTRRDDKRTEKSEKWNISRAEYDRDIEYARSKTFVQDRTEDARKAGIHPLFALGAAGYSPQPTTISGQSRTGSHSGVAIGNSLDRYLQSQKSGKRLAEQDEKQGALEQAQIRRLNSQSQLDELEAMAITSGEKRAEQDAWSSGYGRGTELPDAITTPAPQGREIPRRPLTETSRRSVPLRQEVIGDDGYRYRPISQDAGDEISQADLIYQMVMRMTRQARLALPREVQIQFRRAKAKLDRYWRKSRKSYKRLKR